MILLMKVDCGIICICNSHAMFTVWGGKKKTQCRQHLWSYIISLHSSDLKQTYKTQVSTERGSCVHLPTLPRNSPSLITWLLWKGDEIAKTMEQYGNNLKKRWWWNTCWVLKQFPLEITTLIVRHWPSLGLSDYQKRSLAFLAFCCFHLGSFWNSGSDMPKMDWKSTSDK